jgi:VanZ family protein
LNIYKLLDALALLAYSGFIFWLSSLSTLPTPMVFSFEDKLHHFGAYFIMSLLAWRSFRHYVPAHSVAIASIVFCSLYGVSDEWHQSFVEGRTADGLDWLADALGAYAAMLVLGQLFKIKKQHP